MHDHGCRALIRTYHVFLTFSGKRLIYKKYLKQIRKELDSLHTRPTFSFSMEISIFFFLQELEPYKNEIERMVCYSFPLVSQDECSP